MKPIRPCLWFDGFAVSWQIVPLEAEAWMNGPDEAAAQRVTETMPAGFGKPDLAAMRKAYQGA